MPELCVTFAFKRPLTLPRAYQAQLFGMLYAVLEGVDPTLGVMLHSHKPAYHKRVYAPYVFSHLDGEHTIDGIAITFIAQASMRVRSLSPALIAAWQRGLRAGSAVRLGGYMVEVIAAEASTRAFPPGDAARIRMATPLVLHKTVEGGFAQYIAPDEGDFSRYVCGNYTRKWQAFHMPGDAPPLDITPLRVSARDKCVTTFKTARLCGWYGEYRLAADEKALELLYCIGLGERNGQGFGMFDIM